VLVRMTGFRNFIMRGNLVELAVAVVIGTQFSNLVKQFVSSFVNPLISLAGGTPELGNLTFRIGKAAFTYGQFVTATLSFLISVSHVRSAHD
jgi:large conductance mechanosensitive channel